MPPEKKPEKSDKKEGPPPPPKRDPFVEIVGIILALFVLMFLFNIVSSALKSSKISTLGWKALTTEQIILSHTRPINFLTNPVGSNVVTLNDKTVIYNDPGLKQIGTQKLNSRGKIIQGHVIVGDEKYWYVDYETGEDGWVKESDIAYMESETNIIEKVLMGIFSFISFLKLLSLLVSIIFILWIVYLIKNLTKLRMNEKALMYPEITTPDSVEINPRWCKIINYIESLNENDWRLAIVDADIMLDDLLDKLSLPGDTIGDKLKAVEKSDFTTIDNAWEAHKMRNQVAHGGSEFMLNQREARRIVELYRTVFEEFKII